MDIHCTSLQGSRRRLLDFKDIHWCSWGSKDTCAYAQISIHGSPLTSIDHHGRRLMNWKMWTDNKLICRWAALLLMKVLRKCLNFPNALFDRFGIDQTNENNIIRHLLKNGLWLPSQVPRPGASKQLHRNVKKYKQCTLLEPLQTWEGLHVVFVVASAGFLHKKSDLKFGERERPKTDKS